MIRAIAHVDVVNCQSFVSVKITIPEVLNNIHNIVHFLRFINCFVNNPCTTDCQTSSILHITIFACIMLLRNTFRAKLCYATKFSTKCAGKLNPIVLFTLITSKLLNLSKLFTIFNFLLSFGLLFSFLFFLFTISLLNNSSLYPKFFNFVLILIVLAGNFTLLF